MRQISHFRLPGVPIMRRKVEQALMLNRVQRVPPYRDLWREFRSDLLFFDQRGVDWERERIRGLLLRKGRWLEGYFAFPETVYNRSFPEQKGILGKLAESIGENRIFNDRTHFDKWEVYQHLAGNDGIKEYLPGTYQYTEEDLAELLAQHPSLIFKPRLGHGGAGVIRITSLTPDTVIIKSGWGFAVPLFGEQAYLPLLLALAPPEQFIAQQYIAGRQQDGSAFDVRILMQKNSAGKWEAGGQLSRVSLAANLLTNHYYAIVPPGELISDELLAALQSISYVVAKTLDGPFATLGELGVDFLIDESGRPWILEVNGKPDKGLFWQLRDPEMLGRIYLNPLRYQEHLLDG